MLYDPKTDLFTLDSLITWLETQPPDRAYNFNDRCGDCLIGQYLAGVGIAWSMDTYSSTFLRFFGGDSMGGAHVLIDQPQTTGAALARAKSLMNAG
jgi:hypothetical protein